MWVDIEQNGAVSPWKVVLYVKRMPECTERQGSPGLRGGSMELCSRGGSMELCLRGGLVELCLRGGLLGVYPSLTISHIG